MGAAASTEIVDKINLWSTLVKAGTQYEVLKVPRMNTLAEQPKDAKFKLCVVQFKIEGATNGGSDKGPDGNRVDSIPIANSVIMAGGSCEMILYDAVSDWCCPLPDPARPLLPSHADM